jgi:hypothetical protein
MKDEEPLLCRVELGLLRPMSGAAEDAIRALPPGSIVRIEVKQTRGNWRRLAWYWVMLKIAVENLADRFDGPVNSKMMHSWLKARFGLSKPVRSKKTGEIIGYDEGSISFHSMPENERAPYIEGAVNFLAEQLGTDPSTLRSEAERG